MKVVYITSKAYGGSLWPSAHAHSMSDFSKSYDEILNECEDADKIFVFNIHQQFTQEINRALKEEIDLNALSAKHLSALVKFTKPGTTKQVGFEFDDPEFPDEVLASGEDGRFYDRTKVLITPAHKSFLMSNFVEHKLDKILWKNIPFETTAELPTEKNVSEVTGADESSIDLKVFLLEE